MTDFNFIEHDADELGQQFIDDGYVILPAENKEALERIRQCTAEYAAEAIGENLPNDIGAFLDDFHERVPIDALNAVRLKVIEGLNSQEWLRAAYFQLARQALFSIVGNELAMQRRVNLSMQLPNDTSSLLPVHADVWSGDSPYEIVLWVPLVDCYQTKSMYLMPPEKDRDLQARLGEAFSGSSASNLFDVIENDVQWMNVPYGHVLIFSQTLMHGNQPNEEADTRWTMNCRLKSLFSPYADKRLGEFFEPITLRPASKIALDYELPKGFSDD